MKATWRVYSYDLVGNEDGGYDVNDVRREPYTIFIDGETATDKEIIKELIQSGAIRPQKLNYRELKIDGEPDSVLYIDYKGSPAMEIRKE